MPRTPRRRSYAAVAIHTPLIEENEDDQNTDTESSPPYPPSPLSHQQQQQSPTPTTEKQWSLTRTHQANQKALDTLRAKSRLRTKTSLYIARFRRFRWLIDVVLLLVNISLSALLLLGFWKENVIGSGRAALQVGGDYGGNGPVFATEVRRFGADARVGGNGTFAGAVGGEGGEEGVFGKDELKAWEAFRMVGTEQEQQQQRRARRRELSGKRGGDGVVVDDDDGDGGAGSELEKAAFGTAMDHQLQCVFMMARVFSAVDSGARDALPKDYEARFLHCVDYLRQAVMCSADMAMEPVRQQTEGYHVCKDRGAVGAYLEEQVANGIRMTMPLDGWE